MSLDLVECASRASAIGVVVAAEEALLPHPGDEAVQSGDVPIPLGRLHRRKAGAALGVGVVEVQVIGAHPLEAARRGEGLVQVRLKGGQGHEVPVHQLRVPAIVAVVGEGHDGVAPLLVFLLDLLLGPVSVGQDRVAVEIRFVELPLAGQKLPILDHRSITPSRHPQ